MFSLLILIILLNSYIFAKIGKIPVIFVSLQRILKSEYRSIHIPAEHRREFHTAHHGLRIRHLHHDGAAVPPAKLWRGHYPLRTVGNHDLCCYRMAVAWLRHVEQTLADSGDIYHRLDHRHIRSDSYRRPYLAAHPWCGTYLDQHLFHAV